MAVDHETLILSSSVIIAVKDRSSIGRILNDCDKVKIPGEKFGVAVWFRTVPEVAFPDKLD